MDRKPVVITISIAAILVILSIIGAVTAVYYLQLQGTRSRAATETEIAALQRQGNDLQERLDKLEDANKKLASQVASLNKKLAGGGATGSQDGDDGSSSSNAGLVRAAITNSAKGQLAGGFSVQDIKIKSNWATGVVRPNDTGMEGAFYLLRKEGGKWKVVDFGTGLEHSDYPSSPAELWP